tara:strand:- start:175 stop:1041 length:867 start_codon:yes stop_codon:yes gene_type:complete
MEQQAAQVAANQERALAQEQQRQREREAAERARVQAARDRQEAEAAQQLPSNQDRIVLSTEKRDELQEKVSQQELVTGSCDIGKLQPFFWPPPEPSAQWVIPRSILLQQDQDNSEVKLGDIMTRLERALNAAKYTKWTYQYIGCSGVAMTTEMERIDERGRPLDAEQRFSPPGAQDHWSLSSYIIGLFQASPGFYRQIVFAITDNTYDSEQLMPSPTAEEAQSRFNIVATTAPKQADKLYSSDFETHVLIYEFEKLASSSIASKRAPSPVTAVQHIEQSGIYAHLIPE